MKEQKLSAEALLITRDTVRIYLVNETYISNGKAIGRAARALTHVLPNTVELIEIVLSNRSVNGTKITINRSVLERVAKNNGAPEELWVMSEIEPAEPGLPTESYKPERTYLKFQPVFGPGFKQSLFDPDDPLRFQVFWKLGGSLTRRARVENRRRLFARYLEQLR